MKSLIKALLGGCIFISTTSMAGQSIDEILDRYYPSYDREDGCRTLSRMWSNDDSSVNKKYTYCINFIQEHEINTPSGKRLYVITSGYNTSGSYAWADALAGMFILKSHGDGWVVDVAKPYISVGVNGRSVTEWSLHEFAPNTYGFLGRHQYGMNGGTGLGNFVILLSNGKTIIDNHIPYYLNTTGTMFCQEDNSCTDLIANLQINHTKTYNGFYPLDITINGKLNRQNYINQRYQINYQPKQGYMVPKNYPFNQDE